VEIEHIARERLTAWRTTQQQRDLTVGHRLLREVVINDEGVFATITEVFAHRAARISRDVLHRCGFRGRGGHHNGVRHRAGLFQLTDYVGNRGRFLSDGHVDTEHVLAFLIDDGIHCDGRLTRLAVADDQLSLATAHGHHRVNRLQAGLHRLRDGLTPDHTGRYFFNHIGFFGIDRALAINWLAQRVHHPANQFFAHWHIQNAARGFDHIAFGNAFIVTEDHCTDRVALEVQREANHIVGELEHLALHHVREAVHAADAVGHGHDRALVAGICREIESLNFAFQQFANFRRVELH